MAGLFITVEGPDGSGKSTQIKKIKTFLIEKGYDVVVTREPGGTPIGEKIREIILDREHIEMDEMTEALLYAASRAQHVAEVISPAVKAGKIVICDRFVDSSIVYQGIGRGLGVELVENINKHAVGHMQPHVTFLFKLSPEIGIQRKQFQGNEDRLEREKMDFHNRVFTGYMNLEDLYPTRIKAIDASGTVEEVFDQIKERLHQVLSDRG